ncbi:MAG TPA: hypothetical protein VEJ46_14015 [Candidatus Acidoferrum sp.]|nr:hypothetical protein [Candidatus Acidoferrum sp.]
MDQTTVEKESNVNPSVLRPVTVPTNAPAAPVAPTPVKANDPSAAFKGKTNSIADEFIK